MASLAAAQAAKASLRQKLQGQPWLRGVGITQLKCLGPDPYEIVVNVDSAGTADLLRDCPTTPRSWMGVPVGFAVVGNITALEGVTSQDYANVLLGAMCMTAAFLVGEIVVKSIIEARREHFDAAGQPPEAVKAKESTVDGVVKFAAMGYSLWTLQAEVPALLRELKGFLK